MAAQRVRPDRRGDGLFVRGGGLAGTGGLSVDSDYSGRPLPELTEADVRRATDSLGEDLVGEILQTPMPSGCCSSSLPIGLGIRPSQLHLEHLDAPLIMASLAHFEVDRGGSPASRSSAT